MAEVTLILDNDEFNDSIEIGDIVYYLLPGSNQTTDNPLLVGPVTFNDTNMGGDRIIQCDNTASGAWPPTGSFLMFSKDNSVNSSSVLGYYAEVELKNNSKQRNVEIFSIGSEVFESSK